jgi:tRNA (cytidine/uridine-2'-O-)-methyltransferase
MNNTVERHIVLVSPDVHWNTGNIGRTCLGAGARLHLIEPLGFSLDDKAVKRAGLDYWPLVDLQVWPDFQSLQDHMGVTESEMALFTKNGNRPFWEMPAPQRLFLVFGSETRGLPGETLRKYQDRTFHIPITGSIRSLNLSTAAGIALYESMRHAAPVHGWPA